MDIKDNKNEYEKIINEYASIYDLDYGMNFHTTNYNEKEIELKSENYKLKKEN